MDHHRFDALIRSLGRKASRRHLVTCATGAWLMLPVLQEAAPGEAKRKRKRKHQRDNQRPQGRPNEFGCINVGDPCENDEGCCSSFCDGPPGDRTCRAHDAGDCPPGILPSGCGGTDVACTTSLGRTGRCSTTTGNAGYCLSAGEGFPCKTDAECQAALGATLGPGAACIRCPTNTGTEGTLCAWLVV